MIVHSFIPQVAKDYGVEKAVLLYYFALWIEKNAAESQHFHDGRFWACSSQRSMAVLFPYLSEDKVQRHIAGLLRAGVLLKGSFNDNPTDRTAWYTFSDKFLKYLESIPQNYGIHSAKLRNRKCSKIPLRMAWFPFRRIAECIPRNHGMIYSLL